mgnify:FL=1
MKSYISTIISILEKLKPQTILDIPSGEGVLLRGLTFDVEIDGVDLYELKPEGYRGFHQFDMDNGLPKDLPLYDAIVSCEGLEHLGNPLLFLENIKSHLNSKGVLIISTPNIWPPSSKLKFLMRGFFPSFPNLAGKIIKGSHMHIMPWSYPSLYLFLKLAGFDEIRLHSVKEKKPKHLFERFFGWPQTIYCNKNARDAASSEVREYWTDAGSLQSVYGRHLVVSAIYNK